jgi:hypothetical protein
VSPSGVSLQISLAPTDYPHAVAILPHQLRQWRGQVDDVAFTLDLHRAAGRFSHAWEERRPKLDALLGRLTGDDPGARVQEVDYGGTAVSAVGDAFFGGLDPPPKDSRGGPFYSYFYALWAAREDLVLHMDSDMLFGGGGQSWVEQAVELLAERPDVLACSPLPGPPTTDGGLVSQSGERLSDPDRAFRFHTLSTRVFLLDRARLVTRAAPLPLGPPPRLRSRVKARIRGNPSFALPEDLLTRTLQSRGLERVDFLGRPPGMWSLHPPFRSDDFYAELPDLVARVEAGDVPDAQRGDHDLNDSMIDWTAARRAQRRSRWRS